MNKSILLFAFTLLITFVIQAQEKVVIENNPDYEFQSDKTKQPTKVVYKTSAFQPYWGFGGNLGLSFWNSGTDIYISPKAYYHVSPKFITGVGLTYMYSDGEYWGWNTKYNYHSNSYGPNVSALFRPIQFLQLSAEYEGLQTEWRGHQSSQSYWVNAIYLGVSFISGPVSFGFRYDVLYDANKSAYGDAWTPFIGVYF